MIAHRAASQAELPDVTRFYRANDCSAAVAPGDCMLIAQEENEIVGVVRICEEDSAVALRGMYVKPELQRRGLGSALLREASQAIGVRSCYCVPYTHLQAFYSRFGFHTVEPGRTRGLLRRRRDQSRARGLDVVVMLRLANRQPSPGIPAQPIFQSPSGTSRWGP
jgi:GNAT superfamily N-acetyltransferase